MRRLRLYAAFLIFNILLAPRAGQSADFIVYNMYHELDMGNPGETPRKDYYINMGSASGLREGSLVDVIRRVSTYDVVAEKLYRDMSFKVATLKIIHVEPTLAVARLEKNVAPDKYPIPVIKGIMLGDSIQLSDGR